MAPERTVYHGQVPVLANRARRNWVADSSPETASLGILGLRARGRVQEFSDCSASAGVKRPVRIVLATMSAVMLASLAAVAIAQRDDFVTADQFRIGSIRGFGIGSARQERDDYFRALAATGANVGRLFFSFTRCATCTTYEIAAGEVYRLDEMIETAGRHRLKLILVAQFQNDERGVWWSGSERWQGAGAAWQQLARRYRDERAVAAYELFNEPIAPGQSVPNAVALWARLTEQLIRAIREVDTQHLIIVQPPPGGHTSAFAVLRPFSDPGIVYSFHYYTPHDITHQRVSAEWSRVIPYPAGAEYGLGKWDVQYGVTAWNKARIAQDLEPVRAFARRYKVPVFVGEFSCVRWAPDGSARRYIGDLLELFRTEGWSWSYHEFRGWPGWDPEIASEDPAERRRDPDAPVMRLLKDAIAARNVPGR